MPSDQLRALDLAREGKWEQAHHIVQKHSDELSCLIHAYLHRQEGDEGNARYWYSRAGSSMPDSTLNEELERLCEVARR